MFCNSPNFLSLRINSQLDFSRRRKWKRKGKEKEEDEAGLGEDERDREKERERERERERKRELVVYTLCVTGQSDLCRFTSLLQVPSDDL